MDELREGKEKEEKERVLKFLEKKTKIMCDMIPAPRASRTLP